MKYYFIFFVSLICFANTGYAQKATIRGLVSDSSNEINLSNAVVYLLGAKDSIMLGHVRTKRDGSFQISNVPSTKILFLISYPNYAVYTDVLDVDSSSTIDLKAIYLLTKARLLENVIVKGSLKAIKIKGDTTEYNADSFHTATNATVEELLKKLPGIRVDKNGQITAQGEKVAQVLVDGEEFFGDDPTLVTQNLTANMVSTIQVYDKKQEKNPIATSKTINLKLKEQYKNSYLGKAKYGQGINGHYDHKITFINFKGKEKFASYAIASNIGKGGLNADEEKTFQEDASLTTPNDNIGQLDNWNGNYNGRGLPILKSAGLHYNNKWNDDKQTLNADYKIQGLSLKVYDSTQSATILPDTIFYGKEKKSSENKVYRNKINAKYEAKIDSSTILKFDFYGEKTHKESNYGFNSVATDKNSIKINEQERTQSVKGNLDIFNSNLNLIKRLDKTDRKIIIDFAENYKTEDANGYLFSNDLLYKYGIVSKTTNTDQYKTNKYSKLLIDTKLTYIEPINDDSWVSAAISLTTVNSVSNAVSFNKNSNGDYKTPDPIYTSNFAFKTNLIKGELGYNILKAKYYLLSDLGIGKTDFKQTDNTSLQTLSSSFTNLFPSIRFKYDFARYKRFWFNYFGQPANPSLQQVQDAKTNIDPLNIIIGNPNLKPSFTNNFGIAYWTAKHNKTDRDLYIRLKYNAIANDISLKSLVDSFGRAIYQYINVKGNRNFSENIEYNYSITKAGIYLSFNATAKQKKYVNNVNNQINTIISSSKELSFSISKEVENKYAAAIDFLTNYASSKSSIQKNNSINYISYTVAPTIDLFFPNNFRFHSECNFTFWQTNAWFIKNTHAVIWDAWVETTIFKNNNLQIRASINDILNQNTGYSIDANTNYISQNGFNLLKRFSILSIVWNFSKSNTVNKSQ